MIINEIKGRMEYTLMWAFSFMSVYFFAIYIFPILKNTEVAKMIMKQCKVNTLEIETPRYQVYNAISKIDQNMILGMMLNIFINIFFLVFFVGQAAVSYYDRLTLATLRYCIAAAGATAIGLLGYLLYMKQRTTDKVMQTVYTISALGVGRYAILTPALLLIGVYASKVSARLPEEGTGTIYGVKKAFAWFKNIDGRLLHRVKGDRSFISMFQAIIFVAITAIYITLGVILPNKIQSMKKDYERYRTNFLEKGLALLQETTFVQGPLSGIPVKREGNGKLYPKGCVYNLERLPPKLLNELVSNYKYYHGDKDSDEALTALRSMLEESDPVKCPLIYLGTARFQDILDICGINTNDTVPNCAAIGNTSSFESRLYCILTSINPAYIPKDDDQSQENQNQEIKDKLNTNPTTDTVRYVRKHLGGVLALFVIFAVLHFVAIYDQYNMSPLSILIFTLIFMLIMVFLSFASSV